MPVIRGTVVDAAGAPVAHAAIYVVSSPEPHRDISQLSAGDGSFALGVSAPGTYVIGARSDTGGQGQTSVEIGSGDEAVPARIALAGSA